MESLGGVGYCESLEDGGVMNIARLFRDGAVNSIWEGTSNILAEDFVRVVKGRAGEPAIASLDTLFENMLRNTTEDFAADAHLVKQRWDGLRKWLSSTAVEEVLYQGREVLQQVQELVCAHLLMIDAENTGQLLERVIAHRWLSSRFKQGSESLHKQSLGTESANDALIFIGLPTTGDSRMQSRL